MPCILPDEEVAMIERDDNLEAFGVKATDFEVLTEVSCRMMKMIEEQGVNVDDSLVRKWIRRHKEQDKQRKKDQASHDRYRKEERRKEFMRLKKEFES